MRIFENSTNMIFQNKKVKKNHDNKIKIQAMAESNSGQNSVKIGKFYI